MEKAKSYIIRQIDPFEHEDDLMEMQRVCFPDDEPVKIDIVGEWWIAFLNDAPAAFAAMRASTASPLTGYFRRAGVLQSHIGNGLQRRLIRVRNNWARKVGWHYTITNTAHDNHYSMNNLIASGYQTYIPETLWAGKHSVYWFKFLGDPAFEEKAKRPK